MGRNCKSDMVDPLKNILAGIQPVVLNNCIQSFKHLSYKKKNLHLDLNIGLAKHIIWLLITSYGKTLTNLLAHPIFLRYFILELNRVYGT